MFILYLIIALTEVVGFPSLQEWQKISKLNQSIFNPIINLVPFKDGLEISTILNIIFFMPFGVLLPTLWRKYRMFWNTLYHGIVFSIIIEVGQIFVLHRVSDINDLIMNTIGTICGWIIFNVMSKIFQNIVKKTVVSSSSNDDIIIKLEPYLYIGIAIISAFFS